MNELFVGADVELCTGFDQVYKKACAGSRGIVRGIRTDQDGFQLVYVEWDQDHFMYAGQPDGWTFANHFRLFTESDLICDAPADQQESEAAQEQYIDAIMDAFDEAADSQGFILVAIRDVSNENGIRVYDPIVLAAAITEEAAQILKELGNPLGE